MSFLKKLFGGGDSVGGKPKPAAELTYEGFHIISTPIEEGGQYRVCAIISKEVDGELKEHKLVRADLCSTINDASDISIRKAKQMIDERGDRVFD